MTLVLTWLDDRGAVRFEVDDLGPLETVWMVGPSDRLFALRGYEGAAWHEGVSTVYGYHYEMPLGMVVTYAVADESASYVEDARLTEDITTPNNEAWLRDLVNPQLSQKVLVVSTDDEVRQGRNTIINISGRSNPVVLYDVRISRSGTLTLLVANMPNQEWGDTSKEHMDALLFTGRPLLFSMCMSKGFPPLYLAAMESTYTKIASGGKPTWLLKITYQEIDNPSEVGLTFEPEVTWDVARSLPTAGATFQDWKDYYPTWLDLALNKPQGGDIEPPPELDLESLITS